MKRRTQPPPQKGQHPCMQQREHGYWWPTNVKPGKLRYWDHAFDMKTALGYVKQPRFAIQAGAHVGMWPLWLSDKFTAVYSFEPHPINFRCAVRNNDRANVHIFNAALSDCGGTVELRHAGSGGGHNIRFDTETRTDFLGITPTLTIDSFGFHDNHFPLDFIMLDIEGYELPALCGAVLALEYCKPVIQLEMREHGIKKGRQNSDDDTRAFLKKYGYKHVTTVRNDEVWVHPENSAIKI